VIDCQTREQGGGESEMTKLMVADGVVAGM
jgi:hypothetical protein